MSRLVDKTATYKKQLDQWIIALGLPQYQPANAEVENIIEFTRESLRERSSIQLSEDSVILAQYNFFLQHKMNECQTFLRWSNQVISCLLGDDKTRLNKWIRQAELRIDRIAYLTRRIELIGQSIANLVRARYNERK